MSGLVGLLSPHGEIDRRVLTRMARAEDPRGPDARPTWTSGRIGLAMAHRAAGPGDAGIGHHGTWTVALAGELDNARPLGIELLGLGAHEGASPAALVAQVFSEIGVERGLARLEGAVALVAWDAARERLWLVRDRTGLRALTFGHVGGGLAFATDAAALHTGADVALEDVQRFVLLGMLPPPHAGVHGAQTLAPGTLLRVDRSGETVLRWWDAPANPAGSEGNRDRWQASVENALRLAALRDLPEGAALADGGGVASTLLAAQVRDTPHRLSLDNLGWGPELFAEALRDAWYPTLIGDPAYPAWWLLARAAADRGCRSLVTGHGATALFGARLPVTRGLRRLLTPPVGRIDRLLHALPGEPVDTLRAELEALEAACPSPDPVATDLWFDRQLALPERELHAVDVAAGAHGLLFRAPFAGALMAQVCAHVPIGLVAPRLLGRGMLARIANDDRPHAPLQFPVGDWLLAAHAIDDDLCDRLAGWVEADHIRALRAAHHAGEADHGRRLWRLYALARWKDALAA